MKEYVRRVKATVEESWLDPEEIAALGESSGGSSGTVDGDADIDVGLPVSPSLSSEPDEVVRME